MAAIKSKDIRVVLIALIGLAATAVTVFFAVPTTGGGNITCTSSNCGTNNSIVGGIGGAPATSPSASSSPTASGGVSSPIGGQP